MEGSACRASAAARQVKEPVGRLPGEFTNPSVSLRSGASQDPEDMRHLQIEELEPRQLLACFSLAPPPPLELAVVRPFGKPGERIYLVEVYSPAGLYGGGWVCEYGPAFGPPGPSGLGLDAGFSHPEAPFYNSGPPRPPGFDGDERGRDGPALPPLVPPGPGAALPELLPLVRVDHLGPAPGAAVVPESTGTGSAATPLAAPESASPSRRLLGAARDTFAELPSSAPDPQLPPHLESLADELTPAETGWGLPSPHVSGAVSGPLSFNLSALERGMNQLLEQVEELGQRLGDRYGVGPYSWLVALAAAAMACEIARRQVKQPPVEAALGANGPSAFPPAGPFAG